MSILALSLGWSWFSTNTKTGNSVLKFSFVSQKTTGSDFLNARISPDGKNLLLAKVENKEKNLYLRPLNSFDTKLITGAKGFGKAFFSNDGKWIAFSTVSEQIKKVPIEGGDPITICESCPINRPGFWAGDGYIYFGSKNVLWRVSADGGPSEQLTKIDENSGETDHVQPQLLPDGKTVLFTISRSDETTLGLLSLANKTWKAIEETGNAWYPRYVSTGHIVFVRDTQVMALPFDLTGLKVTGKAKLVESGAYGLSPNIQISNNGTLIYLPTISRTDNQVVSVDKKGEATPLLEKKGDFSSPRISPDGDRIAVAFDKDIWVYNIKNESGVRITDNGKNGIPAWSPDGKFLFYSTEKSPGKNFVHKKSADGTGVEEEIHTGKSRVAPYSLHPTDNILAIASRENASDVILKSLTEKKVKDRISTKFVEDTPRFSPDGKWLAYFSMDTGMPQIYVHPWDDFGKKIPVTKDPGMFPVWSPSGKELFFRFGNKFYSVDVNTSQGFETTKKKFLFEGRYLTSFDVSSDGENFIMVKDEHGTLPSKLNIVLNWTEELKRIMNETE